MAFITKNANLFLLFLIVLASIGLVAATIFFQYKFQNVNQKLLQKAVELQDISKELEQKRTLLEGIQLDLSKKEKREEELSSKYVEVEEEKQKVQEKAQSLEQKTDILEGKVGDLQIVNQRLEAVNQDQAKAILSLNNDVGILKTQNLQYQAQIARLASDLATCQSQQGA
ncbi:hypothetical protein HYV79_01525 [Candidatus Woesearchaeota archaeon]|nr:hypothetical protein [Candidatus Woesearchaeota archaeon]